LFCAENYGTKAASLLVFSSVHQNEIEMGMRIKLWDSKKFHAGCSADTSSGLNLRVFCSAVVLFSIVIQNGG